MSTSSSGAEADFLVSVWLVLGRASPRPRGREGLSSVSTDRARIRIRESIHRSLISFAASLGRRVSCNMSTRSRRLSPTSSHRLCRRRIIRTLRCVSFLRESAGRRISRSFRETPWTSRADQTGHPVVISPFLRTTPLWFNVTRRGRNIKPWSFQSDTLAGSKKQAPLPPSPPTD